MTESQLTRLGREWQARLRLLDWDMVFAFAPFDAIEGDAKTSFNPQLRTALIQVCTRETRPSKPHNAGQLHDAEQCLVHELLHLTFYLVEPREPEGIIRNLWESGIDAVAWALVRAKRDGCP